MQMKPCFIRKTSNEGQLHCH